MADTEGCSVENCTNPVQRKGYKLCFMHWNQSKNSVDGAEPSDQISPEEKVTSINFLNATALGKYFGLNANQINRVLLELGWIEKEVNGWKPTVLGEKLKAQRQLYQKKTPFVVWHPDICKSRILQNAIREFLVIEVAPVVETKVTPMQEEAADKTEGFREKFPPTIRASDGHMVRSRAEAMIDAFFYEQRIVHSYERLVPVEDAMYCDFYLPDFDLYIEFWGMESNPKYKSRKTKKLEIYRQNGLKLLEVKDEHINNLDDFLTAQLVKFGYKPK